MTTKKDYIVRSDGWVAGRRVQAGEIVSLTLAQARYEPVDPVVDPVGADASAPADVARRGKVRPGSDA